MRGNPSKRRRGALHPVVARSRWRRSYVPIRLEQLDARVLPAGGVNLDQWANVSNQWINGQANPGKAAYLEGDTVPYWVGFTGLTPGQTYGIRINLNYYQKNTNAGGFAALNTYNASINPIPNDSPPGSTSPPTADSTYAFSDPFTTDPHPTFFVQNADILSVTYETNVTPTSPAPGTDTDRFVDIVFQATTANPEIYYGLTLSLPGQNFPSVSPPIPGAAGFTGGSLQTSITGTPAAGTPIPTQPGGGWLSPSNSLQLQPGVVVQGSISGLKWNDLNGAAKGGRYGRVTPDPASRREGSGGRKSRGCIATAL